MHKILIASMVALIIVAALVGCSKDCATCPDAAAVLGHARGTLVLLPGAMIRDLKFFSNGAVAPNLDSVKIGDSLIEKSRWYFESNAPYADAHYVVNFSESGDTSTYMYKHGDMAAITAWGQQRSSVCRLKILDPTLAVASVTHPAMQADTIPAHGSDTLIWNKVANVDYYAIMIAWYMNSPSTYLFRYYYTTDTSFVIESSMWPEEWVSFFNVHVTPFSGPDPRTGQSNWTGNLLDGVVYSYGEQDWTTIQVFLPLTAAKTVAPAPLTALPLPTSDDIVSGVYDEYWPSRR